MYSTVDLCILCLTYNKTVKSFLSQEYEGTVIEEKCRFILNENVNIRPEESYICLYCLKNLNYVYKFKQTSLKNIKMFNNYVDTLNTKKHLKVTLTDLQYQKKIKLMGNNESANQISHSIEVVLIKEEIADNCVLQYDNVLEAEEAKDENGGFSTLEKPENINDNMHYSSSLNENHHVLENFLNRVKTETEFNIIAEEIEIKDEYLSDATDFDSEDISNNQFINEGTNDPDNFNDELDSEHLTADDDKKTSKNYNSTLSKGSKNKGMDQNVDSTKRYKCDKCNKSFTIPSDPKRHSCIHTEERPFKCTICEKTFTTVGSLNIHNRTHSGKKPFKCDVCYKTFTDISTFKVHKRIHNNKCSECHKTFTQKGQFAAHMRIHTREKSFKCEFCQFKSAHVVHLKMHMRIHTGEKPFQCQVCQYKCTRVDSLKTHMRIHTGEKPFQCKICEYKGAMAGHLKTHMRIHTGEKPFQCQVCQYKCSRLDSLKIHMRIHTGEKPFQCKICEYKSARSCHLKTHMRIHTGEKPFQCKICQDKFSQNSSLKNHMRVHSGEERVTCIHCQKQFSSSTSLKRHMRSHHTDKI